MNGCKNLLTKSQLMNRQSTCLLRKICTQNVLNTNYTVGISVDVCTLEKCYKHNVCQLGQLCKMEEFNLVTFYNF